MFYARNGAGERILAEDAAALPKDKYFCPMCDGEVRLRKGQIRAKHFAHVSIEDCDSFSSEMSEWHLEWQQRFPEECREVVLEANGEKHRADVRYHDIVIEFQHSPISKEEFERRNAFYTKVARQLVWVFDFRDKCEMERLTLHGEGVDGSSYEWKWPSQTLVDFNPKEQSTVTLLFQLNVSQPDWKRYVNHETDPEGEQQTNPRLPFLCCVFGRHGEFGWRFFYSLTENIHLSDLPNWIDTHLIPELDQRDFEASHPDQRTRRHTLPHCPHGHGEAFPFTRNHEFSWRCPVCGDIVDAESMTPRMRDHMVQEEKWRKQESERLAQMKALAATTGAGATASSVQSARQGATYPANGCPVCGSDMELHPGQWVDDRFGGGKKCLEPFWGCSTFARTHCRGRRPATPPKCPECGETMVVRTNHRYGTTFWGCPKYPECRGTRDAILEP